MRLSKADRRRYQPLLDEMKDRGIPESRLHRVDHYMLHDSGCDEVDASDACDTYEECLAAGEYPAADKRKPDK